ncbi:hypothetical protein [Lacisediminihabitans sp. H27-G8]|uniref:hypothetical protein n=1 Tax=Lacisediminihabitans sp. H27-G8 TaxID=3111909 RepID=UPI0038FCB0A2
MTNNKIAPRAAHAAKPISPLMSEYIAWLKAETGYDVDPMSVQLSGVLRGTFQKSAGNQKRIAAIATRKAAAEKTRAERKAAAAQVEKAAPAKPVTK